MKLCIDNCLSLWEEGNDISELSSNISHLHLYLQENPIPFILFILESSHWYVTVDKTNNKLVIGECNVYKTRLTD